MSPPEEEGEVKEIILNKDQLIEIITRKPMSTDIITPRNARDVKQECSAKFGDEEISGPCISALYFRLGGTPPMLYVPYFKKLYVIGNSDFGMRLASKFDDLVEEVADFKEVCNIIGTKIALMYVTQGTKDVPNGAIYAFVPFLHPNTPPNIYPLDLDNEEKVLYPLDKEAYVYDLTTLPLQYYYKYFVDVADVGGIHILSCCYEYENFGTTWLILRGTYNIKKGDKVKVVKTVDGMPQIAKTDDFVS